MGARSKSGEAAGVEARPYRAESLGYGSQTTLARPRGPQVSLRRSTGDSHEVPRSFAGVVAPSTRPIPGALALGMVPAENTSLAGDVAGGPPRSMGEGVPFEPLIMPRKKKKKRKLKLRDVNRLAKTPVISPRMEHEGQIVRRDLMTRGLDGYERRRRGRRPPPPRVL